MSRSIYGSATVAALVVGALLGAVLWSPGLLVPIVGLLAGTAFVIGLSLSPRTALSAFIAIPPGVLLLVSGSAGGVLWIQYFMIACGAVFFLVTKRSLGDRRFVGWFAALVALMVASSLFAPVAGSRGTTVLIVDFVYFLVVYLLVVNVAPTDDAERLRYVSTLQVAMLASVLVTGVIALGQVGWSLITQLNVSAFPEDAGFLYTRTHFGYVMALAPALTLPRLVLKQGTRWVWTLASITSVVFVLMSVTRGAWIAVAVFVVILAFMARAWRLLLIVPFFGLLYLVPGIRTRLTADFAGGLAFAIQTGTAGSHRVLLWSVLLRLAAQAPVLGQGVGYLSSISPALIFGEGQFVAAENPLVYAHNDFLFLVLDLGLIGASLYAFSLFSWWRSLIRGLKLAIAGADRMKLALLLGCLGVALTTLTAQLVDNGFFIHALFERFIVMAACASVLVIPPAESEVR